MQENVRKHVKKAEEKRKIRRRTKNFTGDMLRSCGGGCSLGTDSSGTCSNRK